jgi:hypothetical protein
LGSGFDFPPFPRVGENKSLMTGCADAVLSAWVSLFSSGFDQTLSGLV